jgi:hypothetical protein
VIGRCRLAFELGRRRSPTPIHRVSAQWTDLRARPPALDQYIAGGRGARARVQRGIRLGLEAAGVKASVNVSLHEGVAAALDVDPRALEREVAAIVELIRWAVSGPAKTRTCHFERIDDT